MECKHKYFVLTDDGLVCSNCGTPKDEIKGLAIEDKMAARPETKKAVQVKSGNKRR